MTSPSIDSKVQPLQLAIIGCGGHSESAHARSLAHYVSQNPDEVTLVAACDRDKGRANLFCERYGFARAYTDIEEMFRSESLDGVISVLPVDKIAEVGSLLLRKGIPCLLEKPLGSSLDEVLHLADIAHATGTRHMVSLNRRFNPFLNLAIDWAKQIAPLTYVRGQMFRQARHESEFVWGTGIHVMDAMRHIGGDVRTIEFQRLSTSLCSTPSYILSLQYESHALGHIEILPSVGVVEERFELFGENFRAIVITMGGEGESVRCWHNGILELERIAVPESPLFLRDGSYEETLAFLHCLRKGIPFFPRIEHALPSLALCQKVQGKRV